MFQYLIQTLQFSLPLHQISIREIFVKIQLDIYIQSCEPILEFYINSSVETRKEQTTTLLIHGLSDCNIRFHGFIISFYTFLVFPDERLKISPKVMKWFECFYNSASPLVQVFIKRRWLLYFLNKFIFQSLLFSNLHLIKNFS